MAQVILFTLFVAITSLHYISRKNLSSHFYYYLSSLLILYYLNLKNINKMDRWNRHIIYFTSVCSEWWTGFPIVYGSSDDGWNLCIDGARA